MRILSTLPVKEERRAEVRNIVKDAEYIYVQELNAVDEKAEILVTFGPEVTVENLTRLPRLRWIQAMSAGVDNYPLPALAERGITLTNARGAHQIQMTEHIMWSMLTLFRQAQVYMRQQEKKVWDPALKLEELYAKTVCIVGAGRIGEAAAEKCRAFGMTVLGISHSGVSHPAYDRVGNLAALEDFLAISDVVVVLLPLTPATAGFFNAERFGAMKKGAYFINAARGPVVDEQALLTALREGRVGAAALDVFREEPLPAESPFWTMANVVVTPHIGGRSPHYNQRTFAIFLKNLSVYPDFGRMINRIDLSKGY